MKNKKLVLLVGLFVLLLGFFGGVQAGIASDGVGSQVTVEGGITFYEESSEPMASSSSTSENSSTELPSADGGKLPQTGEIVRNFSLIIGVVILALFLLLLYRRKKEHDKEEGQS
ncbi:LPXTG cell wall anchor domain-containing protein [Enterococcus sp. HY326]|uniref:LPXTG cell wall anchor domain-containing protein n=1 Tax=Enterococcus sp. HY326 TaxID=2971265 RepID=UPI0022407E96|nr:LPXTG cell wall anchor domain-containing protein [Enterococcus sp. HY326]